jgi:two-component system alkaline phosphatase synthesis response regulator PhoP
MSPKQPKILLVEDNPDQAEIYKMELETAGYEVLHILDATEAPVLAEREEPDLILLDLMLGNLSGLDILKKIKENPKTEGTKVVALTNFREKELLNDERLKDAYDYIYKPDFTPREVVRKVRDYLE